MARRLPPPLIALSPGTLQRGQVGDGEAAAESFVRAARAAIAGGLKGILLREPALEDGAFLRLALRLREDLDASGERGWLGVHDRLHLAAAAKADGTHVGGRSLDTLAARRVVGSDLTLGVSTHAGDDASVWVEADLALHAPVFAPRSKPGSSEPVGAAGLRAFAMACPLPVWAVGGISPASALDLGGCGAAGACTIGALWNTDETPIVRGGGVLDDFEGIEARARALAAAAGLVFAGARA